MPIKINEYKWLFILVLSLCALVESHAQRFVVFSGLVLDKQTQLPIEYATIHIPAVEKSLEKVHEKGLFQLNFYAFADSLTAFIQADGYKTIVYRFPTDLKKTITFQLENFEGTIAQVVILDKLTLSKPATSLDISQVKALPSFLGEPDVLKTLSQKSGFLSLSENSVGLSVRGGESSQNLMLLDGVPVFNIAHLFGFLSNINADVVQKLDAYKGGFSADKGGRISSIIDIETKDGNAKKHNISGGVGILNGRLCLSGPILKNNKLTYLVSARRTYLDVFVPSLNKRRQTGKANFAPIPDYYFADLNAKLTFTPNLKNKITALVFAADDQFSFKNLDFNLNLGWKNRLGSLQWRHFFSDNLSLNSTISSSQYAFKIGNDVPDFSIDFGSNIKNYQLTSSLDFNLSEKRKFQVGLSSNYLDSNIGVLDSKNTNTNSFSIAAGEHRNGLVAAIFSTYELPVSDRTNLSLGIRLSAYQGDGATYKTIEPRVRYEYQMSKNTMVFGSYDRMAQYIHQIYGSGFSLPVDIWYPSTSKLGPQRSHQIALGLSQKLPYDLKIKYEIYYKMMDNQPELIDGALLIGSGNLDEQTVVGFGRGYAACEFELEKKSKKLEGWLSYTLAKTSRFGYESINGGLPFSPRQDIRHNLSLTLIQKCSKHLSFSSVFSYRSGTFAWFPKQRATFQNTGNGEFSNLVPIYQDRNNVRLPAYLRWDLGVIWNFGKKLNQNLTLSVINVTNRRNPYFYYLKPEYQDVEINNTILRVPERIRVEGVRLFPILPSLTWNFSF